MLAHLRTEAYAGYGRAVYPRGLERDRTISVEGNEKAIAEGKARLRQP